VKSQAGLLGRGRHWRGTGSAYAKSPCPWVLPAPCYRRRAGLSLVLRSPAHRQQQQAGACRLIANDRVEAVGRGDVGLALAKEKQRPGRPLGWPLLSRASSGHELGALGRALCRQSDHAPRALNKTKAVAGPDER
jgi:hypothetical protein